jgi:hypothetical protein
LIGKVTNFPGKTSVLHVKNSPLSFFLGFDDILSPYACLGMSVFLIFKDDGLPVARA